jgi:hypothetical protein
MKTDIHFWWTTMARGFLALLVGSAILVIPDMTRTLLLLPIAVVVSIIGVAGYCVLDSTLVLVSSFMVSHPRPRFVLRVQGAIGVGVGLLLLSVVLEQVQLEWFLSLAALQALSLAIGEIVVARHQSKHALTIWNYVAAAVAGCFACFYVIIRLGFINRLTDGGVSWLIYAYLVVLGVAQCLTAARMIYADYHTGRRPEPLLG